MYSDFLPIESKKQMRKDKKLHKLMEQVIDKIYEAPKLLTLAENTDKAYEWYTVNNSNPEPDKYTSQF